MTYLILLCFIKLSVSLFVSIRLENRIPSKISTSSWLYNSSSCFSNEKLWLFQLWWHVCDNAHCITSLIFERLHHFRQTLWTHFFKEPFYIRSRKTFISVKAKWCILDENRLLSLCKCNLCLLGSYLFGLALKLWD